jgi:hypothetical protein
MSRSTSDRRRRVVTRSRESGTFFLLVLALLGCASRGDVGEEVDRLGAASERMAGLQPRLDSLNAEIERAEIALAASREELAAVQAEAALASEQARRAESSASGGFAGETVFRVDGVGFEPGTSTLTETSRILLDQLAARLRAENAAYFLEIQTIDGASSESSLAAARLDAVRRYLHEAQGLPLHSFSAVSGATEPHVAEARVGAAADPLAETGAADGRLAILVIRDQPKL